MSLVICARLNSVCAIVDRLVTLAATKTGKLQDAGKPGWEAWNLTTVYWVKAAEVSTPV